jgi:hypothetical protein
MNYEIAAIPTQYNGINFRSRLEARWAAMFDLLDWEWTYEPVDFDGWIPDFAIHGERVIYVEVKPVGEFPKEVAEKIDQSGCIQEVLIVGSLGPFFFDDFSDFEPGYIGWLRECWTDDLKEWHFNWAAAPMGRWVGSENVGERQKQGCIGFCHHDLSYCDRITGSYDGGCFGGGKITKQEVVSLWRQACNRTQWVPKKNK